jgi:hypothetical protein
MTKAIGIGIFVGFFLISGFSQSKAVNEMPVKTVVLQSPWIRIGEKSIHDPELRKRSCFDLILLEQTCGGQQTLSYGNRFGVNWDIFTISGGPESQTRMIDIGEYSWTDQLSLPEIEPWSRLRPGEKRAITINTSGADGRHGAKGADGRPGMNSDGTYSTVPVSDHRGPEKESPRNEGLATKPITQQVSSTITMNGKVVRGDKYTPFNAVKKGHLYLARVVDPNNDYYLLIRVDDVVQGTKVTMSFLKFKLTVKVPEL